MSVLRGVPNLRRRRMLRIFEKAVLASQRPESFRIVHYGLMHDHFHLIVEARDRMSLARGMQGLNIRIAKRVNREVGRRGRCFSDRYHRRDLRTPLEAHRAIRYVLLNRQIWLKRRGRREGYGIDVCSSGRWFDGWASPGPALATHGRPSIAVLFRAQAGTGPPPRPHPVAAKGGRVCARASTPARARTPLGRVVAAARAGGAGTERVVLPARTWLLGTGWRRWGLIGATS